MVSEEILGKRNVRNLNLLKLSGLFAFVSLQNYHRTILYNIILFNFGRGGGVTVKLKWLLSFSCK